MPCCGWWAGLFFVHFSLLLLVFFSINFTSMLLLLFCFVLFFPVFELCRLFQQQKIGWSISRLDKIYRIEVQFHSIRFNWCVIFYSFKCLRHVSSYVVQLNRFYYNVIILSVINVSYLPIHFVFLYVIITSDIFYCIIRSIIDSGFEIMRWLVQTFIRYSTTI